MERKHLLAVCLIALALVLAVNALTTPGAIAQGPKPGGSRAPAVDIGTFFTYQGRLAFGGGPANGTFDFRFILFNQLSGGSQVGSTITRTVTVTNGLFNALLDFGNVFDGSLLFLEVSVRPSGGGGYTTLSPRHGLWAKPNAIFAATAPWSGLTGVPAGFADGVDDGTTYTAGDGLELVSTQFKMKGTSYQNVVIVAKSGGDFTSIQAALNSILDAADTNRYLVYVAPGVYAETVTMKQYVDIEGAGELATKITNVGSFVNSTGTVVGANNAELRFLTVENTGGNTYAIAIYNGSASPRLTHITANSSGGTGATYCVRNNSSSSPIMTNVTVMVSGAATNIGVSNISSSSPMMTNVTVTTSGGAGTVNNGIRNETSSSPTMTNVNLTASGGAGTTNYGIRNDSSSPTMTNVNLTASGGTTSNNFGIYNSSSSPMMTYVIATASGGSYSYGLYNVASAPTIQNSTISGNGATITNSGIINAAASGTYTVTVNNSQIVGSTNTISNDAEFTTLIGASKLDGGAVNVYYGGTVTCAGVYDEGYTFTAGPACP